MQPTNYEVALMRSGVQAFLQRYRELLASFDTQKIAEALTAYSSLGNGELPTVPSIAAYRRFTESAFLTLYDRGAIPPITPLTKLGANDLAKMRESSGIGYEPPPPTPRQPTAQELLEQRVANDWNTLKVSDFRKNCATDKAYRECFERLSAENRLGGNAVTSLQRAGA